MKLNDVFANNFVSSLKRALLYVVVEDFIANFGLDGRACMLRAICEVHSKSIEKFGLIGEMLKLFFT